MHTPKKLILGAAIAACFSSQPIWLNPLWAAELNTKLPQSEEDVLLSQKITIYLPAQPLAASLKALSAKIGLNITYNDKLVADKQAPALSGTMRSKEALQKLLANTGLEAKLNDNTLYIQRVTKLEAQDLQLEKIETIAKRRYDVGPLRGLAVTKEEIPGNVQSISAKEIKESKAVSLTDLMNSKLQSVNINDYQSNPFQMDVTYRGFTASPQLGTSQGLSVFLDGIRVNEPFGDVVNWDMIPMNALNSLDVFPGSNPLFGLGTLGGAISMKTKSGFDSNEGTVEYLGGSFKRNQFQGSVSGNNGVVAGFAAANIFREDGWRVNSPSEVNQIFAKGEWRNDKLQLGLSMLYAGNKLVGNGLLPTEMAKQDNSQIFTSPDQTKNHLLQFQLNGIWDVSETFNITGQVYKRKSRRNSSTGDINQNFSGGATRRPLPGEQLVNSFADLDRDGLPDPDLTQTFIYNVALDASGNPITDINGNLVIGTNANVAADPNQGTQNVLDKDGNIVGTMPLWGGQYDSNSTGPSEAWKEKARQLWALRNYNTQSEILNPKLFSQNYGEATVREKFNATNGVIDAYYFDANGFANILAYNPIYTPALDSQGNNIVEQFPSSTPGLGSPTGILVRDPVTGIVVQRNGADCDASASPTGVRGQCSGYIEGTPTALITETDIDQVTDGAAMQFNWNLEKHKFMVGASVDASDASYTSGQYLGLLTNQRKAYLDPANVGYEFAAASQKLGLNDFAGNSITKSLLFSETWTPTKEWAFTAAGRYNITHIKNELAVNNYLGLNGPTAFKNFIETQQLCYDNNNDGTVTADECPSVTIIPFSIDLANGLGAIGPGETEKFTYRSFNPSLGATWQPTETLNLYANLNRGARTPSVIELGCAFDDTPVQVGQQQDGTPVYAPRSLQQRRFCSLPSTLSGDPYLKQVRSETLEFGGRGYLTPQVQWNATIYQTDLTDDIYFVSFTPERSFFQNIGNTRRRGLEMGLQGKVGKWGFRTSYSLTDATFQDSFSVASPNNSSAGNVFQPEGTVYKATGYQQIRVHPGDRMPGVPLHNFNFTLSYELTPDWMVALTGVMHSESFVRGNENNKHQAGAANVTYNCGQTGSSIKDGDIMYADAGCAVFATKPNFRYPGKVPGYAVFNFRTSYKLTKNLTAGLLVNNLFDREYYSAGRLGTNPFSPSVYGAIGPGGFNYNSNDWLATTFLAPGAPRSAFFTLTYDFDAGK
ncbi:TonB-dependent receptor [Methylophilus sp. DW102]|uniref:TonB-dependent receptor domain-containing protein n=1 Tax=Methylophilus sp. DW102 TaxID=3095607 RepID=UPI0030899552|nr:TonB-dependent receptor [Methylophilus sp. DW102]